MRLREFTQLDEAWSQKYKSSINCSHPKGFSQKAHCAGKRKHNEDITMESVCPDCGMCEAHGNMSLNEIKKGQKDSNGFSSCWTGYHASGTKKGKNGGRVRNCVKNEGAGAKQAAIAIAKKASGKYSKKDGHRLKESSDRCPHCGSTQCTCPPNKCTCKPIKGWVPNKGFRDLEK